MKTPCLAVVATLIAGTASADIPLFAATWPTHITVDSSAKEQVDVNGKVATLIKTPDGQIAVQSTGLFIDITPREVSRPW